MPTDLFSLRRALAVVLLGVLCTAIAGCGDSDSNSSDGERAGTGIYPADVADQLTRSCAANARVSSNGQLDKAEAEEVCGRALTCVEDRLTIEEFEEADRNVTTGAANPDIRVITRCGEEAVVEYVEDE